MPSPRASLLLLGLLAPATPVRSQTDVGCDASCPPRGYEDAGAHLCPGASVDAATASRVRAVCHPTAAAGPHSTGLSLEDFRGGGRVTVLANYYTGCEAGRREAGVYAGIAQRIHDDTGGRVHFVTSLKGGGNCATWAGIYQSDALSLGWNNGVRPSAMPLTVSDDDNDLRDRFFTPPYPHPSCECPAAVCFVLVGHTESTAAVPRDDDRRTPTWTKQTRLIRHDQQQRRTLGRMLWARSKRPRQSWH